MGNILQSPTESFKILANEYTAFERMFQHFLSRYNDEF